MSGNYGEHRATEMLNEAEMIWNLRGSFPTVEHWAALTVLWWMIENHRKNLEIEDKKVEMANLASMLRFYFIGKDAKMSSTFVSYVKGSNLCPSDEIKVGVNVRVYIKYLLHFATNSNPTTDKKYAADRQTLEDFDCSFD